MSKMRTKVVTDREQRKGRSTSMCWGHDRTGLLAVYPAVYAACLRPWNLGLGCFDWGGDRPRLYTWLGILWQVEVCWGRESVSNLRQWGNRAGCSLDNSHQIGCICVGIPDIPYLSLHVHLICRIRSVFCPWPYICLSCDHHHKFCRCWCWLYMCLWSDPIFYISCTALVHAWVSSDRF